ncbi:protein-(glutamine-N5) methyltransferase, release factor-specific [Verrucomicrobia bacterium SCGC AG-212-E04]|nr:protein-(glutamine-N5) methyltransferase, release factor-specific [Verrucomicrobia bacterium SCGC AG-212-E04]
MSAPARQGPISLLEVVRSSTEYLARHAVESARLNAEHLAAHVLGKKNRIDLYLDFDRPLGSPELDPMRALLRRRANGEPLQHLLGTVEFHGREFRCDARALVPRPETERLVELVLERLPAEAAWTLLDVGTGSGVIALTLAAERPMTRVVAVDRSAEALALARENAAKLEVAARVKFVESDLLSAVDDGPFEVVVANLPYVPSAELPRLSREVQRDPPLALDGGTDGLDLVARLAADALPRMQPGGFLALEIGHDQADRVQKLLADSGWRGITTAPDYQQISRFVFAQAA